MFRRAYRVLPIIKANNVLVKNGLRNWRPFSNIFEGGKGGGGIEPYHVKLLQVNKGKEAKIMELTAQIEAIQMKIKALEKKKSAEAKSVIGELKLVLKDLKSALRQLRMNN